jgi:hypothetical protein
MMDYSGIEDYPHHNVRKGNMSDIWSEFWRNAKHSILILTVVGLFWLYIGQQDDENLKDLIKVFL